jgi:fimbrial chaperone protein
MRSFLYASGLVGLCAFKISIAAASSLQISPTRLELTAPDSAGVITLRNEDKRPVNIQVRVFRWTQSMGAERLEPTTDVVASPPSARITADNQYLLRVVRVAKKPVAAEETYRVLIDELPDPKRMQAGAVNMTVRFSMPVFFRNADVAAASISWSLKRTGKGLVLIATNSGGAKLRLTNVRIAQNGRIIGNPKGISGYVLAGSSAEFFVGNGKDLASAPVMLKGESDAGAFEANVTVGD